MVNEVLVKISLQCLIAVLGLVLAPIASAMARDVIRMSVDSEGLETVDATASGHPGRFLFDSGFGVSAMTPAFAGIIGCTPWGKISGFCAIGERIDAPRCNETKLKIGSVTTTLAEVAVFDLAHLMGPSAAGLSGVIGLDVLAGRTVTLDVMHHELVVEDAASLATIRKTGVAVPIRLVRTAEGVALTVDMGVPTPSGPSWMELDTGNYGPSLVDKSIAGLFHLDPASSRPQRWHVTLPGRLVVSGPVVVKDLILDGNFGRDVLRHWLVTLDLVKGRGWIRVIPDNG